MAVNHEIRVSDWRSAWDFVEQKQCKICDYTMYIINLLDGNILTLVSFNSRAAHYVFFKDIAFLLDCDSWIFDWEILQTF